MPETITIDGSYGEGGGQIIRTSLSLSAVTGRPVELTNVRARRTKPGLQPQHLTAVRAAAALCGAVTDAAVGSTRFRFEPSMSVQAGDYRFDIGTAGAAPLVAQTVLVPLALQAGPSSVTITGGTHVPHAPNADYLLRVYLPILESMGLRAEAEYPAAGFYPRGGGKILLTVRGTEAAGSVEPVHMTERGRLTSLTACVVTSQLPEHVGERGGAAVESFMKGIGRKVTVERLDRPSPGAGAAVVIVAECEGGRAGFSSLGERGKPMERVAGQASEEFMRWWKEGAPCDEHLADQLVLPACFAPGESRWVTPAVTDHLRTVLWVARQFLSIEARLEERPDGSGLVTLTGA